MNVYVSNILFAALSFPLIAFFITLPYMIYQYRRFGSIPWLRTLVVYSFAFYLLCAYFLVLLPLKTARPSCPTRRRRSSCRSTSCTGSWPKRRFAERSVHLAGPLRDRTSTRRSSTCAAGAAGHVPALLFPPHVVADARHRFSGDAVVSRRPSSPGSGLYEHPYRLFDVDDLMLNTLRR
ncbi:MAG: hypothetical protein ACLR3C_03400 [Eggerthella lenta]